MSLIGKIGTAVARIGGGLVSSATGGLLGGALSGTRAQPFSGFSFPGAVTPGAQSPGIIQKIQNAFPGSTPQGCPRGYHLNKKPLAACKSHGAVKARSMCVRNRSMNPMNYRALTKSLKRIKRAGKIVRKIHAFNQPRARLSRGRPVAISENLRITAGKS
jgi:hypothetical protein